jgi:hypothetical protein
MLVLCFLGLGLVGYGVWRGNLPPRPGARNAQQQLNKNLIAALAERGEKSYFHGWFKQNLCEMIERYAIGGDGPQTLLVGDSHTHMLAPRIHELLNDGGKGARGAVLITREGACPLPGLTSPTRPFAQNLIPVMMQEVASNPAIDRVVIVAFWPHYFSECWKRPRGDRYFINDVALNLPEGQEMALSALGDMVSQLVDGGKQVTVVLTVPWGKELDPRSGYRRGFLGGLERTTQPPLTVATFRQRHGLLNDAIATIARASGADVIDPVDSLQMNGMCIFEDDDAPIRQDSNHLRAGFSRRHATYIDSVISP